MIEAALLMVLSVAPRVPADTCHCPRATVRTSTVAPARRRQVTPPPSTTRAAVVDTVRIIERTLERERLAYPPPATVSSSRGAWVIGAAIVAGAVIVAANSGDDVRVSVSADRGAGASCPPIKKHRKR